MLAELQDFIDQSKAQGLLFDPQSTGIEAIREVSAAMRDLMPPGPDMARVEDLIVPAEGADLPARLYVPSGTVSALLVYLHGGGWVLGDMAGYDSACRCLALASQCAVLSVEYRLAPEHPFPVPFEDSYAATAWAAENGCELLGKTLPLVIGGDSAGGNLSAAVALAARNRGGPEIAAQLLIYPVTDADFSRPSYAENASDGMLTSDMMQWFWGQYAADEKSRTDPYCAPMQASDLSGLPPAMVEIAECDPLRSEGEAYSAAMAAAGTPVTMRRWYGYFHGYFHMATMLPMARRSLDRIGADLGALVRSL